MNKAATVQLKTQIFVFVLTYFHLEVVEGMLVDVFHLFSESHGVVGQGSNVGTTLLIVGGVIETRGCHVSGTNGLDLL